MSDFETYAAYGRSIGYAREAGRQQGRAEYWEDYAHKLEAAILELRAGSEGHKALEKALINELKPNSPLHNRENRGFVYTQAYEHAKKTLK